jgi:hypothetical protein
MANVRASVNQRTQIGVETVSGTGVAATKILEAIAIEPGIKNSSKSHRAQGRKHTAVVTQGKEYMEAKAAGDLDYNEIVYPFSSIFGAATITTPGGGTNSRQWVWTPPLSGSTSVKTFTVEKGDAVRAFKFAYGLFSGVNIKATRDDVAFTGTMIGQAMTDGISLTSALAPVGMNPVLGNHLNVYVDATSAGLGGTLISDVLEAEFGFDGAYGPYWPMIRANNSYTQHVDLAPKTTIKLLLQADASGMSYLTQLRSGVKQYMRLAFQGPTVLEAAIYPTLWIDAAVVPINVQPFSDKDGVYAVMWEFELVEDNSWGQALQITNINMLTAL